MCIRDRHPAGGTLFRPTDAAVTQATVAIEEDRWLVDGCRCVVHWEGLCGPVQRREFVLIRAKRATRVAVTFVNGGSRWGGQGCQRPWQSLSRATGCVQYQVDASVL